jgi:monoamine oxidase
VRGGQWERVENFWQSMNGIFARIRGGRDRSFADFLRTQRGLSPRLKEMALAFVEGFDAAHADRISALALREESDGSDFKQFRIADGYDAVIGWLRAGLDPERATIRLGTAVTEIAWRRGEVTVHVDDVGRVLNPSTAEGGRFAAVDGLRTRPTSIHAAAAVITVPAGVLKSPDTIRFTPVLHDKQRALDRIEVGHVVKLVLRFRRRFWDDFTFAHCDDPHFPTWWTTAPVRAPLMTGWAGGHAADRLLAEGGDAIVDRGVSALASILGVSRRRVASMLDAAHVHDWQADPFSRGAYSYAGVGGSNAHRALAKPVADTLFFAGEATSDQTGTVAGAIESGRRAARQILMPRHHNR